MPLSFVYENKEYSWIKVPRPCEKFVMLEDMRKEKFRFMIHVITPEFAPVVIGRSSDCDLRINDISVSRSHATIDYDSYSFFIKDSHSKFGTLVLISNPISVNIGHSLALQVNKTFFSIKVKKRSKLLNCCDPRHSASVQPLPRRRTQIPWEEICLQSPHSHFDI